MQTEVIERAKETLCQDRHRPARPRRTMKQGQEPADFASLKPIIIGFCWATASARSFSRETQRVLEYLLKEEIEKGKVDFALSRADH